MAKTFSTQDRLSLLDQFPQYLDIFFVDLSILSEELHERPGVAVKEPPKEIYHRSLDDILPLDRRKEDMGLAFRPAIEIALLRKATQQSLNRVVTDIPFRRQPVADLLDGSFAELPDQSEDFRLGWAHGP
jgi:hypothetical protein